MLSPLIWDASESAFPLSNSIILNLSVFSLKHTCNNWLSFQFTNAYEWDGANIVVEICYDNRSSTWTRNGQVLFYY